MLFSHKLEKGIKNGINYSFSVLGDDAREVSLFFFPPLGKKKTRKTSNTVLLLVALLLPLRVADWGNYAKLVFGARLRSPRSIFFFFSTKMSRRTFLKRAKKEVLERKEKKKKG